MDSWLWTPGFGYLAVDAWGFSVILELEPYMLEAYLWKKLEAVVAEAE